MFVWNTFTNDARVLRECTTLSKNDYIVDLICLHDPKLKDLPRHEEINGNFNVYRLDRYPKTLLSIIEVLKFLKGHILYLILSIILWFALGILFPKTVVVLSFLLLLVLLPKTRVLWIRGSLIFRMTLKGYKGKYDIYHANDLNTLPQAYVSAKCRFKKKVLIYDSHEVQTSRTGYNSPLYKHFEHFFVKKVNEMIVENHTRAAYNKELYGNYPHVLHNYPVSDAVNDAEPVNLHEQLNLNEEEKILLYQGGIQEGRGLEKLIEAFPFFKEGTLVFIGDGRIKPKLQTLVEEANLSDKIKFLDKVPLRQLPGYTRNAYLGFQVLNNICFNHYSASSNKLFEYMMSKVPVIACDFPEIGKVVKENHIGETVDPHDPLDIARAVNKLLDDEKLRNKYSESCILAQKRYNWDLEQQYLLNIYNNYKEEI